MGSERKIRVVLANSGLDVHDRGAKIIAKALIDSGMEVIYLGLRSTPEEIVETAIQEDVDAIGISNLSGAHVNINSGIIKLLRERNASDILLVAGGIIYEEEKLKLRKLHNYWQDLMRIYYLWENPVAEKQQLSWV